MYDFGKPERKIFLDEHERERKQRRNTRWLLIIAASYIAAHIIYYVIKLL